MPERFQRLDALRGLLALGVVFFHCGYQEIIPWYWASMDFFFVMSGFLITRTMINLQCNNSGLCTFLVYRACRLLPSFTLILLAMELLVFLARVGMLGPETSDTSHTNGFSIYYLTFIQNLDLLFSEDNIFNRFFTLTHFWSLILEEQFYLIWGAIFFSTVTLTARHRTTIPVIVTALTALIIFRLMGVHWWTILGRADGFIIGSVLGILEFSKTDKILNQRNYNRFIIFGFLLLSIPYILHVPLSYTYDINQYFNGEVHFLNINSACFFGALSIFLLYRKDIKQSKIPKFYFPFIFVGAISYELYLVHYPIIHLLPYLNFNINALVEVSIVFTLSLASAWLMHNFITRPVMKRRKAISDLLLRHS